MAELKECPFCGGKWEIKMWDANQWYGRCTCCNKYTSPYSDYQAVVDAINRRPSPSTVPLTLEELRKMGGEPF